MEKEVKNIKEETNYENVSKEELLECHTIVEEFLKFLTDEIESNSEVENK